MFTTSLLSSFARREDGNAAMILALSLFPIIVMMGFAFDIQRAQTVKLHVQTAADAAALAGAREYYDGSDNAANVARDYFLAAMSTVSHGATCEEPSVTTNDAQVSVTLEASCSIETTVGGLVGREKITLGTASSASSKQTKLDLALMLDVSGSMSGQKLTDLKEAADNAVDILLAGATSQTKIAITPYATSVNLGDFAEAAVGADSFDATRDNPTCVTERPGADKTTDAGPEEGSYVGYETTTKEGSRNITCPTADFLPLTNNSDDLKAKIASLSAGGWTAGQLGVAWSWYAISPDWNDIWPAESAARPYEDSDTIKAVVLMTDGSFNTTYDTDQGNSVNQSKVLCSAMRDQGVIVYSVAFQAPPGGQAVLADCATSEDHYFEPEDGDALIAVYGEIAASLSNLRLTN